MQNGGTYSTSDRCLRVSRTFLASRRLPALDRKSTRLNSSHSQISYAVFCLKKKNKRSHAQVSLDELPDARQWILIPSVECSRVFGVLTNDVPATTLPPDEASHVSLHSYPDS